MLITLVLSLVLYRHNLYFHTCQRLEFIYLCTLSPSPMTHQDQEKWRKTYIFWGEHYISSYFMTFHGFSVNSVHPKKSSGDGTRSKIARF